MSVTKLRENWQGRTKSEDTQSSPPTARYTRRFLAVTDDRADSEDTVLDDSRCPQRGDYHPVNSNAVCVRRRAEQLEESPLGWHVTCEYSTNWAEIEDEDDPTFLAAHVDFGTAFVQLPLIRDAVTNAPIVNTAGDPFDPPLMVDYALTTATVQQNVLKRPTWLFGKRNHVNDAAFTLDGEAVAAGIALLRDVKIGRRQYHNDIPYYPVTVELLINDLGHKEVILNDGLNELFDVDNPGSGSRVDKRPIMVKGEPVQSPVPLDDQGRALLIPDEVATNHVFLAWNKYRLFDFSLLGLPA